MDGNILSLSFGVNNCYLIREKSTIMIDGGPPGKKDDFVIELKNISVEPQDVRLIVITHAHSDHIGSARDIKELTGAKIAMHELDAQSLETGDWKTTHMTKAAKGNRWGWLMANLGYLIAPLFGNVPSTSVELVIKDDGFPLRGYGISGQIVYTPGHTMGSISVLLDSGEAFVGDLAMNRLPMTRKPGLPILAEDIDRVKESWRRIIDLGATIVYPGHGKPFSIDAIKDALK